MLLSLLNFKGMLKRTITSDLFNGIYTCDGENKIRKDSKAFKFRQMFLLQEVNESYEPKNNAFYITFEQRQQDVYLITEAQEARLLRLDGNRLVFVAKGVEHFLLFNS